MVAMLAVVRVHGGTFQGSMGSSGATPWEGVSDPLQGSGNITWEGPRLPLSDPELVSNGVTAKETEGKVTCECIPDVCTCVYARAHLLISMGIYAGKL